jgi:hypothetical protein
MCHGHVDLRVIEREVQDRLRAAKPVASVEAEADVTVPPGLIGGLPGISRPSACACAAHGSPT